ncbi:hypothetical protein [Geodermatophilus sp. FMUSA9-8]|uniref:hypothetical protein n=1 Tax=Geodermatophilus sp. FMUSA9-8 TaxID=3120155 RepID=UPI00300B7841
MTVDLPAAVVAGEPFQVTVRCAGAGPIAGGVVELVRDTAVTHTRRQWAGAVSAVADRDTAVVARADLDPAGCCRLAVPPGEATIAGHLVQRDYSVLAWVRGAAGPGGEGAAPVRVLASAPGAAADEAAPEDVNAQGPVVLSFADLPGRTVRPGTEILGTVTATAREGLAARGVRVELVLDEHVPARAAEQVEDERSAVTVVATVSLSGPIRLTAGESLRWPFRLRAPDPLPAPTTATEEFTVRWLLRAVVDRAVRTDCVTTVGLRGSTAP